MNSNKVSEVYYLCIVDAHTFDDVITLEEVDLLYTPSYYNEKELAKEYGAYIDNRTHERNKRFGLYAFAKFTTAQVNALNRFKILGYTEWLIKYKHFKKVRKNRVSISE